MRRLPFWIICGTLISLSPVFGQYGGWGGGWGGGYHSSTAEEGIQRGRADVVRSQGMKNLMDSEAVKNIEDARAKNINNRVQWTKAYFEMKRTNKEYRDAQKGPRPTSEQLFRLAKEATPKRLGPSELDPVTGAIDWPLVLKDDTYADYVNDLDQLFAERAKAKGKLTLDQFKKLESLLRDLQIELKRRVHDYPPQSFVTANSFLKRLAYESRVTAG